MGGQATVAAYPWRRPPKEPDAQEASFRLTPIGRAVV